MILYHGSLKAIETPDISHSRENTDFGKGFYTTTIESQAEKWTNRFKRRFGYGTLSLYKADEAEMRENISILDFDTYSPEWLDFIIKSRRGETVKTYDLVIGGIANDDVYNTLTLFFKGFIGQDEAIRRLQYGKPNIQYCFRNQGVIDNFLEFIGMETL